MLDISVIVPVYQAEEYLERCLQSLAQQTLQNFEVILIDDGSTDGSASICDAFVERNQRFCVVHQANHGIGFVRNLGLQLAKGEYIAFADADDYTMPEMLEKMLLEIKKNNADLLICDYFIVEGDKARRIRQFPESQIWQDKSFMQYVANEKILSFPWNKMYRRELFTGIAYPLHMVFEDQYVFHRLAQKAACIAYTAAAYYYYRINPDGLSRSINTRNAYDCFIADLDRHQFMQENYPQYADACWNHIVNNACNTYWRYLYTGEGYEYARKAKAYLMERAGKLLFSKHVSGVVKIKILMVILCIDKLKWQRRLNQ